MKLFNTKWEAHYTGIETAEKRIGKLVLYVQRDRKTKRLEFARLSAFRRMLGIHIGSQNYGRLEASGGFQLFTTQFHFGVASKRSRGKSLKRVYSGSMVEPYAAVTFLVGRVVFGARLPKWIQDAIKASWSRRYEADYAKWLASLTEEERLALERDDDDAPAYC